MSTPERFQLVPLVSLGHNRTLGEGFYFDPSRTTTEHGKSRWQLAQQLQFQLVTPVNPPWSSAYARNIHNEVMKSMGHLVNTPIICIGENRKPGYLPQIMVGFQNMDQNYPDIAYNINMPLGYSDIAGQLKTLLADYSSSMIPEELRAFRDTDEWTYIPGCRPVFDGRQINERPKAWVLRNYSTHEYVHSVTLGRLSDNTLIFGDILLVRCAWTSPTEGVMTPEGNWAGHRFYIMQFEEHLVKDQEFLNWEDVTEEVVNSDEIQQLIAERKTVRKNNSWGWEEQK